MHWALLPLFAALILLALRLRVNFSVNLTTTKLPESFRRDLRALASDFLRVNWSGQPQDLHLALKSLLDKARAMATERNVVIDEDMLRAVLVQAIAAERLVKRPQLAAAMDSIERPAPRAA